MSEYNFKEHKNTMVITTQNIIKKIKDIEVVFHDEEDGIWQFLDGEKVSEDNAAIISLYEMVTIDDSINELYDLPLGAIAYRETRSSEWKRKI